MTKISLHEYLKSILYTTRKPWVVFAGAGISFTAPSFLPLVTHFTTGFRDAISELPWVTKEISLLKKSGKKLFGTGEAKKIDLQFELFIQKAHDAFAESNPNWVQSVLCDLYSSETENVNHQCIADYVRKGKIAFVITTNFDRLLEFATDKKLPSISTVQMYKRWHYKGPAIVHLHADVHPNHRNSLQYLMKYVGRPYIDWREKLLSKLINYNCIFVGYGGNDQDIRPHLHKLSIEARKRNKRTRWIWLRKETDCQPLSWWPERSVFETSCEVNLGDETKVPIQVVKQYFLDKIQKDNSTALLTWLGTVCHSQGMRNLSYELLQSSISKKWSHRTAIALADWWSDNNGYSKAATFLEKVLKRANKSTKDILVRIYRIEAYRKLAYCQNILGRNAYAQESYRTALSIFGSMDHSDQLLNSEHLLTLVNSYSSQMFTAWAQSRNERFETLQRIKLELDKLMIRYTEKNAKIGLHISYPYAIAELHVYYAQIHIMLNDKRSKRESALSEALNIYLHWNNRSGIMEAGLRLALSQSLSGKKKKATATWIRYVVMQTPSFFGKWLRLFKIALTFPLFPKDSYWVIRARGRPLLNRLRIYI